MEQTHIDGATAGQRPETEEEERPHIGWRLNSSRRNCSTLLQLNVHFLFVLTLPVLLWCIHNGGSNGGQLAGIETEEMAAVGACKLFTVPSVIFDRCLKYTEGTFKLSCQT